ncbi:MAG: hypothetical protein J5823_07675, partial [Paludibacteraceae bacterium]|nr:hypothetical protein [Paludibacteraceae bacterium]
MKVRLLSTFITLTVITSISYAASASTAYLLLGSSISDLPTEHSNTNFGDVAENPEQNAANWYNTQFVSNNTGTFIRPSAINTALKNGISCIWVNIDRTGLDDIRTTGISDDVIANLKAYVQAGGNLLLTKQATMIAHRIGRIYEPMFGNGDYYYETGLSPLAINPQLGLGADIKQQYDRSNHPIFDNVDWNTEQYTYSTSSDSNPIPYPVLQLTDRSKPYTDNDCIWPDLFRKDPDNPTGYLGYTEGVTHYDNTDTLRLTDFEADWNCQVLACWGHVQDFCSAGLVEMYPDDEFRGTIIALGFAAYQWGTSNALVGNVQKLTENALRYLGANSISTAKQPVFLNFSDVQSIDDWTITNATRNETETTMYEYLETYVYDIYANIPGVAYVTDMPDITFTMESTSDKTKAFYVGINRGYYGFYQTGGKNGIITIKNTQPYDIITLEVASKGSGAASFSDPKGQFPINAVALTQDLTIPAKNSGAEGEDDSGYTYRTLVYYSTGGDVQIKECAAGFRLRSISVEPGEAPTVTVLGKEIPTDTTGVIDLYGDSTMIYDTEENTLTINNLTLEVGEDESTAISYSGSEPLTIVLNDSSTILADTVISSTADIVITGEGHLIAEGVTPIIGAPTASITFEAVNMHVRSLPSPQALRRRIKGGKRLDETGGPALSGFGSADFNKTNVSPSDAEY